MSPKSSVHPFPADEAVSPALADAMNAEDAWRAAVATLAAADEELMDAEEAVASLRARESDRIAAGARAGDEAARHRARVEQDAAEADRMFSLLMGESASDRRDWIEANARYADNIDA